MLNQMLEKAWAAIPFDMEILPASRHFIQSVLMEHCQEYLRNREDRINEKYRKERERKKKARLKAQKQEEKKLKEASKKAEKKKA